MAKKKKVKNLFCEKCNMLFDEGTEKCSDCGGELEEADEATLAKFEEKMKEDAIAAEKEKTDEAKAKKEKSKCKNCDFRIRNLCHRNPPQGDSVSRAGFPRVKEDDWCGEHRFLGDCSPEPEEE